MAAATGLLDGSVATVADGPSIPALLDNPNLNRSLIFSLEILTGVEVSHPGVETLAAICSIIFLRM